jgi:hypothetical protein
MTLESLKVDMTLERQVQDGLPVRVRLGRRLGAAFPTSEHYDPLRLPLGRPLSAKLV